MGKNKRNNTGRSPRRSQPPQYGGQSPMQEDIYNVQVNFQNFGRKYPTQQRQTTYASQKSLGRQLGKGFKSIDNSSLDYRKQESDNIENYNQKDEANYAYVERRLNDFQKDTSTDRENLRKELEEKIDKVKETLNAEIKDKASGTIMRWIFGIFFSGFIAMFGFTLNRCTDVDKEMDVVKTDVMELKLGQKKTMEHVEKLQMSIDELKKQNGAKASTAAK